MRVGVGRRKCKDNTGSGLCKWIAQWKKTKFKDIMYSGYLFFLFQFH